MAIPPLNIDLVNKAADLGWVTRKQADKAIGKASSIASVSSPADALAILQEMGAVTQEGLDCTEIGKPAPVPWWCFRRKQVHVEQKTIEQNILKKAFWSGTATPDQVRRLFVLFPENEWNGQLTSLFLGLDYLLPDKPGKVPAFKLISQFRDRDIWVAAWECGSHVVLSVDNRPRWSLQAHYITADTGYTLTEQEFSSGVELQIKDGDRFIDRIGIPTVETDLAARRAGIEAVLKAAEKQAQEESSV